MPIADLPYLTDVGSFEELYRRDVAYVDTNKSHNILLGDDGRPHLIDFQISFAPGILRKIPFFGWLAGMLLRRLHEADVYHIHKHWRRLRPPGTSRGSQIRSGITP